MRSASSDACATWGLSRKACLKEPDEPMVGVLACASAPFFMGACVLASTGAALLQKCRDVAPSCMNAVYTGINQSGRYVRLSEGSLAWK